MPYVTVVNLSTTFGKGDEPSKFAKRYLKITHCDLFFADAAILVEGSAERMLIPHFIRNQYEDLDSRYITILEIGGRHAWQLKSLIDDLGLLTLIVTDIDSVQQIVDGKGKIRSKKFPPQRNQGYLSGNDTLKKWLPQRKFLDDLLTLSEDKKISENSLVRVAYQHPIEILTSQKKEEVIPYTFEDALVFSNIQLFKNLRKSTGLLRKMSKALSEKNLAEAAKKIFKAFEDGKKAEMALELLYLKEPGKLHPPMYISEGLEWLQRSLKSKDLDCLELNDDACGDEV